MAERRGQEITPGANPPVPEALLEWMKEGWVEPPGHYGSALPSASACATRRSALSARFPGIPLVVASGTEKVRANDTVFRFRPSADFVYLMGAAQPREALVLAPASESGHEAILFTEPDTDYSGSEFFTDHERGTLWVGPSRGLRTSQRLLGVKVLALDQLASTLAALEGVTIARGVDPTIDALVLPSEEGDQALASAISELRLYKDDEEVEAVAEACRVTALGFEDIVRALPTIRTERQVDAVFQFRAITDASDVGYPPIAAAGSNATVLHWTRRDGALRAGELLLVDAGAETADYYTADVTRTLPISGSFSQCQRRIYELVWRAHQDAVRAVRPGAEFVAPHRAAMAVIAEGLCALGILRVSAKEALREDRQLYKRYTIHNVSHMLGIDVHDCSHARPELSVRGTLAAGMIITIEPGIYFQVNDQTVPEEYRGIGIRIEDDILVTKSGYRVLSDGLPVAPDAVEEWMARIWTEAFPVSDQCKH
jgi:Xaa-Pro aminopeptidase